MSLPADKTPPKPSKAIIVAVAIAALCLLAWVIVLVVGLYADSNPTTAPAQPDTSEVLLETRCYFFKGVPAHYVETSQINLDDCLYDVELRGEISKAGKPIIQNNGELIGRIRVEPVRKTTELQWGKDLDEIVSYLEKSYYAPQGEILRLREPINLDGVTANKTTVKSTQQHIKTKDFVVVLKDPGYTLRSGAEATMFMITVTTPENNGEQILANIIKSWRWR
ncbi:MAG TPA: hypothetical protein VF272_03010 [Candidatus Saccharimonadia bacterium]